MILAAGLGTRLRPLTLERPKAAVPVAGLPAAAWAARAMARAGMRTVAVNLHHLPDAVKQALHPTAAPGLDIVWSPEPGEILGTGGGIRRAAALTGSTTLVVANGDVISDIDLGALLEHHRRAGADATLALLAHPDHRSYGTVLMGPDGTIRAIAGRRSAAHPRRDPAETPTLFTGVHVLGPGALARLPEKGCVVRDTYFGMLDAGLLLAGYVHRGYWNDIGTPARYLECNLDVLRGRAGALECPWPVNDGTLVHPEAHVSPDADLGPGVIVGPGAQVGPGSRLSSCVVWDGARVTGTHRGCVISRSHVVEVEGT